MPKKLNGAGGMQEYIPAGNGDASGEYGNSKGENKHFSSFSKNSTKGKSETKGTSGTSKSSISNNQSVSKQDQNDPKNWSLKQINDWYNDNLFGFDTEVKGNRIVGYDADGEEINWSLKEARYNIENYMNDMDEEDDEWTAEDEYDDIERQLVDAADEDEMKSIIEDAPISWTEKEEIARKYGVRIDNPNNKPSKAKTTSSNQVTYNGKDYDVDSTAYNGAIINAFGTSITDEKKQGLGGNGYTVFDSGDEIYFDTFDEAYNYAKKNERKKASKLFNIDL